MLILRMCCRLGLFRRWGWTLEPHSSSLVMKQCLQLVPADEVHTDQCMCDAGIYNIITGWLFDIPMPVQPMKAIAAVAIASSDFDLAQVMAAGIFVGAVVVILGATRLIDSFHRQVLL